MDPNGIFKGMGLAKSSDPEESGEAEFDPTHPTTVGLVKNDIPFIGAHKTVRISINNLYFTINTGVNRARFDVKDILSATVDSFKPQLSITTFANEDVITTSDEEGSCCRVTTVMKT